MTFDKTATLRVPLTADRNVLMNGISGITARNPGGSTDIYRA
jgi:hypothetical protein